MSALVCPSSCQKRTNFGHTQDKQKTLMDTVAQTTSRGSQGHLSLWRHTSIESPDDSIQISLELFFVTLGEQTVIILRVSLKTLQRLMGYFAIN